MSDTYALRIGTRGLNAIGRQVHGHGFRKWKPERKFRDEAVWAYIASHTDAELMRVPNLGPMALAWLRETQSHEGDVRLRTYVEHAAEIGRDLGVRMNLRSSTFRVRQL